MKLINNKKGFTLIELLSVIVVLALIMVIAVNGVFPMIDQARTGGFATTANTVVEASKNKMLSDEINGNRYQCYTVENLIDSGFLEKISLPTDAEKTNGYEGIVLFEKVGERYEYTVHLVDYANNYKVVKNVTVDGNVEASDIDETKEVLTSCPADVLAP